MTKTLIPGDHLVEANDLDGVLALAFLLAQEAKTTVFPRQIVMSTGADGVAATFVHGVPDTTSLTSAMTVQHKRMRRGMLERNGVPIPTGATFSIAKGVAQAPRYARKIGFPVVVKPAKGDPGTYEFRNIQNPAELNDAIDLIKVPVHAREGVFRGAYTPMELGKPGHEGDREIVASTYRFLVEEQPSADGYRAIVSDGKVVSAVHCLGSPLDGTLQESADVLDQLHPELTEMLVRAGTTIPDLAVVAIDFVSADVTAPIGHQKFLLTDMSERPFFWVQATESLDAARGLSERLVSEHLGALDREVSARREDVSVRFTIEALPSASTASAALPAIADDFGVELLIDESSDADGRVSGTFGGNALVVARLLNGLTNDEFEDVPAMLVDVVPV